MKENNQTAKIGDKEKDVGWTAAQDCFSQTGSMKNCILLDIGSSTSIFCNPRYCQQIRPTSNHVEIQTNSGSMIATETCKVSKLGQAYFNNKGLPNIIGLGQMRQKYRVTYDSTKEATFCIHLPNKIIKFPETFDGLYAVEMEKKVKKKRIHPKIVWSHQLKIMNCITCRDK